MSALSGETDEEQLGTGDALVVTGEEGVTVTGALPVSELWVADVLLQFTPPASKPATLTDARRQSSRAASVRTQRVFSAISAISGPRGAPDGSFVRPGSNLRVEFARLWLMVGPAARASVCFPV